MNDADLLNQYVSAASQDAFAQLVQRHINLVYSIALRSTRDAHVADDVTQAVFLVLAKKAKSIRNPALLPAWLMSTTRYAANNARRGESRRQRHEHEAAAMHNEAYTATNTDQLTIDTNLAPLLDHGLFTLKPADRTAVLLRYIHNKSAREIGQDMGISEQAAQKRLSRALQKIRTFLLHRGVTCPTDTITTSLEHRYLQAAPQALLSTILAHSMKSTVTTATSANALAKATLKTIAWAQAKLLAAACATCLLIAGGVTLVVVNSSAPASAGTDRHPVTATTTASAKPASTEPSASQVLLLPNDSFTQGPNDRYEKQLDDSTTHTPGGPAPLLLQSSKAGPTDTGIVLRNVDLKPFLGKRIRFSAWIKSDSLKNWGGLMLFISDEKGHGIVFDDMQSRGLTGSADWTKAQIVCDVSPQAKNCILGPHMHGAGQLFMDDARIEIVDKSIPATDDSVHHMYTAIASNYSAFLDPNTQRNGHPTFCITSSTKPTKSWAWYGGNNHYPQPYLGHHIRVTGWIKTEKVTGSVRLSVWAFDPHGKLICIDDPPSRKIIKGTTDWKKYDLTATIPEALDHFDPGMNLFGNGKVWIDDLKYELIPDDDSGL